MMAPLTSVLTNRSKVTKIIIVLVIGIVVILYSLVNIMYQNFSVNQRIESLRQEIADLKQNSLEQQNKILYYATDAYVEKTLREKLNYQLDGEKIYAVQRKDPEQERLLREQRKYREQEDNMPNLVRWWRFFFPLPVAAPDPEDQSGLQATIRP